MAVCKKCGYNNPDDAHYCANCKADMMGVDPAVMKANMDRVNQEFENDARATLDVSRLTFICDVCGKVNPINVPGKKCVRCGKKMPRSAYLTAVKKMQKAGLLMPPADTAPVLPPQFAQQNVEQPVVEQPEYPQPAQQMYRMSARPQPPQQNGQVIQPFVIVPYVSQSQPVYQYQSNVVYRFDEYSEEEKKKNQETLVRYQKERREAEIQRVEAEAETQRLVMKKQAKINKKNWKLAQKGQYPGYNYGYGDSNVRITSIFTMLFAIAAIFVLFFLDAIAAQPLADANITFALYEGMAGTGSIFNWVSGLIAGAATMPANVGGWLMLIGSIAFGVVMLAIIVQSIIRIIKGYSSSKAIILPILAIVTTIVAYVGYSLKSGTFDISSFAELWPNYIYCAVIMVFVPLIMILIGALTKTED